MTPTAPDDKPTPPNAKAAPPGRGLMFVRLGFVVALGIGVLVFGIFAINDLTSGMARPSAGPRAQTRALEPGQNTEPEGNLLGATSVQDLLSQNYTAIDHDPAHMPAFPGARRDFCKRYADGEQYRDEQARYISVQTTVQEVLAHYQRAAAGAGFTPRAAPRPLRVDPDGRQQVFLKGESVLTITVFSPTLAEPQPPPAAPPRPMLSYTVQFRYPIRSAP